MKPVDSSRWPLSDLDLQPLRPQLQARHASAASALLVAVPHDPPCPQG